MTLTNSAQTLGPNAQAIADRILGGERLTGPLARELVAAVGKDGGVPKEATGTGTYFTGIWMDMYEAGVKNGTNAGRMTVMSLRNAMNLQATAEWFGEPPIGAKARRADLAPILEGIMDLALGVFRQAAEIPAPPPAGYIGVTAKKLEEIVEGGREYGLRIQILDVADQYPGAAVRISSRFYFHPAVEGELQSLLSKVPLDDPNIDALTRMIDRTFRGTDPSRVAELDREFAAYLSTQRDDLAVRVLGYDAADRQVAVQARAQK